MITSTIIVCIAAFCAGFIDAIVGGGGLIQTPVLLMTFPNVQVATLLGTSKIPAFSGTSIALYQYTKRVSIDWKLVGWVCLAAFCTSFCGSALVSHLSNQAIKPIILAMLILVGVYTFTKKNFGQKKEMEISFGTALFRGILSGLILGFYDGFIGPGTGSFLVLVFISLLGCDFMNASANAKAVNLATNLASILYFSTSGHIIYQLAIPMAVCNMTGGFLGAKLALLRGNKFIRIFFLVIVCGTIVRFAYDIFFK